MGSNPQTGTPRPVSDEWEGVRQLFRETKTPMTRENYLDFVHMGTPPPAQDIEEGSFPPELRKASGSDAVTGQSYKTDPYTGKPYKKMPVAILGVRG